MDWLSFIASVVGSLSWPATAFGIVLLLRKHLINLLPSIRRLKAGPVEAEFEREVEQLKAEATLPAPETRALQGPSERLYLLAQMSPRAAVLEAWQGIEFAAKNAVLQHAGSPIPDMSSPLRLVKVLAKSDLMTQEDIALFQDLRGLRNQAIHSQDFNPSFEAVSTYLQLAQGLEAKFSRLAQMGS